ncbi:hypothetical protein L7F22_067826 [Adiantum nelumboides]|nr:hypothetical protein [Adiantum nelumboides]
MELSSNPGQHHSLGELEVVHGTTETGSHLESDLKELDTAKHKQRGDGNDSAAKKSVPFFKLFCYADNLDCLLMLVGALGATVHGAAMPIFFIFFGKLVDIMGSTTIGSLSDLSHHVAKGVANFLYWNTQYSLDFVYLSAVVLVAGWTEVSCWIYTGERQSARIRLRYLKAMLDQDVGFFDTETSTGEIVVGISSDTILVQEAIGQRTGNFIHYVSRFFAGFGVGFSTVWQLSLLILSVVPLIAMAGGFYAYIMVGLTNKSQDAYVEAGEITEQVMSQIRTVYAFGGEKRAVNAYTRALKSTSVLGKKGGSAKGLGVGSTYSLLFLAWALLLWYSGKLVRSGVTNGAQAFTTIVTVVIGGISLGQAALDLAAFGKAKVAGYTIMQMINKKPRVNHIDSAGVKLSKVDGHIQLRHVTFSYPSRPEIYVFQDFSLNIPDGKAVAIVSESGSGKSTVISLIERFYDPIRGEVLLDGHDIKGLQLKWLRDQLALVSQEPALFATTIRENILYGKDDATMEDVVAAANISGADTFIDMLPKGYETQVGERGLQLSGGQKQRIAIARAMIKNPSILLLDEATSALDADSEKSVQEALDRVMMGRTTVVVAHRLSTIRNADSIAVVQNGRVVEFGTHSELMSIGSTGAYTSLVKLQEAATQQTADGTSINQDGARTSGQQLRVPEHVLLDEGLAEAVERIWEAALASEEDVASQCAAGISELSRCMHETALARGLHDSLSHRSFSFQSSAPSEHNSSSFDLKGVSLEDVSNATYYPHKPSFGRLLKMNAPDWHYGLAGCCGALGAGAQTPLFAFALTHCLVMFYSWDQEQMKMDINKVVFIICGASVFSILSFWSEHYFFGIVGEHLTMRVREMMFSAILKNEIGWFDKNNSSLLAGRLASDGTLVKAAIADRIAILLQNCGLIMTAFSLAFWQEWRIALVVVAAYPALVGSHMSEILFLKGFGGDLSRAYSRSNMVAGEAVSNIRTIAAFCAEDKVVGLFGRELEAPQKKAFVRGQIAGIGYGVAQFCMYSTYGLGLWYASTLIQKGLVDFGAVMKCFMVLVLTAFGIAETLALAPDIVKGSQALSSVFEILDRKTEINPDDPEGEEVKDVKGAIELKHIDFSYPSRPGVTVFKDFNLRVHSRRSIALVGSSGSGKSTVVSLIARFYDPLVGQVLIDGKDIRRLKLRSLRQHMGLVQQEPALFSSSIYANILYGKEGATEGEIIEAAKAANAHEFVSALSDGYETEVGERGVQLSGGQKQRIAIARAVLRDPAILLLDEATSALDAESEKLVQDALDRLTIRRTTVIVAHRLSTIKNADNIAVLQDGAIVEQGTHQELMAKLGSYFELVSLQHNSG